jgi:hypothetical protein
MQVNWLFLLKLIGANITMALLSYPVYKIWRIIP